VELKDVFTVVHDIRRAKYLNKTTLEDSPTKARAKGGRGKSREREPSRNPYRKKLHKLEGAAKKRAWDEGACLNCGGKDHFIAECPKLKSTIKSAVKKYAAFFSKDKKTKKPYSTRATAGSSKKLHHMKNPTGTQKEEEEEEDSEEDDSEISETDSEAGPSGTDESEGQEENSCPESEG
jgi:hypothetical protein